MTNQVHDFDPFAKEVAYIRVNEKLIDRLLKRLNGVQDVKLLDIAAGTGLMTNIAFEKAEPAGVKIIPTLLDLDRPALQQAQIEVRPHQAEYVYATADVLPISTATYDAVIFANSLHMLDDGSKDRAIRESFRVLKPGGILAINSTFYDGAYPDSSKPFYSRWIRRAIGEINQRLPKRDKAEKVEAIKWLTPEEYRDMVAGAGFRIIEMRQRVVHLSQSSVKAISTYKEFAKGALHATDDDAEAASQALQASVKQAFNDLKMKFLARNWLEVIAVKP
ncbi:MAG TPA: methyltransferase domain-containing protein [Dehalococcoidia bacterium]|nr:methyltransferase domain-containing protein [Dehalococcoidia bacterium]